MIRTMNFFNSTISNNNFNTFNAQFSVWRGCRTFPKKSPVILTACFQSIGDTNHHWFEPNRTEITNPSTFRNEIVLLLFALVLVCCLFLLLVLLLLPISLLLLILLIVLLVLVLLVFLPLLSVLVLVVILLGLRILKKFNLEWDNWILEIWVCVHPFHSAGT